MASLNKVLLIGYIGQDIKKKVTENNISIASFSLATTEHWKDKEGNKQEKTEWHNIVCFTRLADIVSEYCSKGSQIYIEGNLQTVTWEDKDQNKRYTTQIKANNIQFLDSKSSKPSIVENQTTTERNAPVDDMIEDDIPFNY